MATVEPLYRCWYFYMLIEQNDTPSAVHPYGEIWVIEGTKAQPRLVISRVHLESVSYQLGFRLYQGDLYRLIGIVLFPMTVRQYRDAIRDYVDKKDITLYNKVCNALEAFLQHNANYTISNFSIITRDDLLSDTKTSCYKFFKNGYIHITPLNIMCKTYDEFPPNKLILSSKIAQRDFNKCDEGKYLEFLKLATNWNEYELNIKSIIGYLAHEYKDETTGYIIVLTEQCADPKDGGGSGKNIFCNLFKNTTTYHSKNASQANYDESFFQSWNGERIMGISEAPKNFPYEFLKEPATGTIILRKLYKNAVEIPVEDGPKFVIQTNFHYDNTDGGMKRRIIPIEFTNFFTKAGGVDVHFGCHFPSGWSVEDWHNYDTVIIDSIQQWLVSHNKIEPAKLTETGWEKQFEMAYGLNLMTFIMERFDDWVEKIYIPSKDIHNDLKFFYDDLDVLKNYRSSPKKIAEAIKDYSTHLGYNFKANVQKEINLKNQKCYFIYKN